MGRSARLRRGAALSVGGRSSKAGSWRSRHPRALTTRPPPTWTTGTDSPKNSRTYVPVATDASKRTNALTATRQASAARSGGVYSDVIARKIGRAAERIDNREECGEDEKYALDDLTQVYGHGGSTGEPLSG